MRVSTSLACLGLATALILGAAHEASAGGRFGGGGFQGGQGWHGGHRHHGRFPRSGFYGGVGVYDGYGYGGYGDGGDVVTNIKLYPSVHELVPPVQGYGSYGIPTVAGIAQAPTAAPTVYVIDGARPVAAKRVRARSRILSRGSDGRWADERAESGELSGGARIVSMTVSQR